jgi:hypothetical protein
MRDFNVNDFLGTIGAGRTITEFRKNEIIYAQGVECDAVFYIQSGKVRLTVVATNGKEATIAILNEDDFLRRRLPCGTAATDGIRNHDDRLRGHANRERGNGACAPPRTYIVRKVRGIPIGAKHPIPRGFG